MSNFLKSLTLTGLLAVSVQAKAAITFSGGSGFSGFSQSTAPVTYYGGIAGVKRATNLTPPFAGGTVDTCAFAPAGVPLFACNNAAIIPETNLVIMFQSSTVDGVPSITFVPAGSTTPIQLNTINYPSVHHNGTAAVSIPWGTICNVMATATNNPGVSSDCSTLVTPGTPATFTFTASIKGKAAHTGRPTTDTGTFQISIVDGDPNTQADGSSTAEACDVATRANDVGICHFEILAGHGKVKLQSLHANATFPNLQAVPITKLLVLWAEGKDKFANITAPALGNANAFVMVIAPGSTAHSVLISPAIVSGLKKNTDYSFKIALEDAAGNIGYYTASDDVSANPPKGPDYSCIFTAHPTATNCHMARTLP